MRHRSLLLPLVLALVPAAQAQVTTPAIQAIRDNYNAVNAQISAGNYRKTVEEVGSCGDFYEIRTRWKDGQGQMRRYQSLNIGSTYKTDSEFTVDYWFDQKGRRDFVLAVQKTTPADPKADFELRVYYNDAGAVIRTLSKPQQQPEVVRELLVNIDHTWTSRTIPFFCE